MTYLTEIELCLPHLDERLDGLQILQVSDLHSNGWSGREALLHQVLRTNAPGRASCADLVVISGDMCHQLRVGNPMVEKSSEDRPLPVGISRHGIVMPPHWRKALAVTDRLLEGWSCPMGICLIQGNHDSPEYMAGLAGRPVRVLNNEAVQLTTPAGVAINVCGSCGYGRAATDVPATMAGAKPDLFTLAVSHFPEFGEPLASFGADLVLSGHTHGGQVCKPGRRAMITHSRTGTDYVSGLKRLGRGYIHTSRGLGTSMLPIRLNCPPEVTRFTLRRGDYNQTRQQETEIIREVSQVCL